jgi:hypothetical protein
MKVHTASIGVAHQCLITAPRAGLDGEPAAVKSFDRRGAVLSFAPGGIEEGSITVHDPIDLDLILPASEDFGQRAIRCLGRVIQTSEDTEGRLWVVVRFRQMFVRCLDGELSGAIPARLQPGGRGRGDRGRVVREGGDSPAKEEL